MTAYIQRLTCLAVGLAMLLTACSSQRVLMPTPNLHVDSDHEAYASLHEDLR